MSRGKQPKSSELRGQIALRFKAARVAFQGNGAQLARELGISAQTLNAYERARNFPDESFLVKFCQLTGCTMDWLYRGELQVQMPAKMAAHIGAHSPELIADSSGEISVSAPSERFDRAAASSARQARAAAAGAKTRQKADV